MLREWYEISMLGLCYEPRELGALGVHSKRNLISNKRFTNELVDGCLIDIGGSVLQYQTAGAVRRYNNLMVCVPTMLFRICYHVGSLYSVYGSCGHIIARMWMDILIAIIIIIHNITAFCPECHGEAK